MALTRRQNRHLRALAHHLQPVVQIGNARTTPAVVAKVDTELENHELIKVKIQGAEREELVEAATALVEGTRCALVQTIGHILVLYRARKKKPTIRLPRDPAGAVAPPVDQDFGDDLAGDEDDFADDEDLDDDPDSDEFEDEDLADDFDDEDEE